MIVHELEDGSFEVENWNNCITPDCQYKVCTWANEWFCFKCCERQLGRDIMIQLYNSTHDIPFGQ